MIFVSLFITAIIAFLWLKSQGYRRIAIEGVSKGAEYALASAVTFNENFCLILKTPTWYYGEGLVKRAPSNTSSWSYKGEEFPYTTYKERAFKLKKDILFKKEYNILSINTGKVVSEASIIPIEKVNGPVLIFSTKTDTVWPSSDSGERLISRLEAAVFRYPYRHICFDHMSHMMFENANSLVRLLFKSERNYPKECKEERKRMREETENWLKNIWF